MDTELAKQPRVGVGGIVLNDGKVLLVKRGKQPGYGKWSIPGGMLELGETLEEGMKREIREECSIEVELTDVVAVLERIVPREGQGIHYHYVLVDFLGYWKSGELQAASDILEARWANPAEMEGLDMTDRTREVVLEVMGLSEKGHVYYGGSPR